MNRKKKCIFVISMLIILNIFIVPSINANKTKTYSNSYEIDIIELINKVNKSLIFKYHEGLMAFGARYTGSNNITLAGEYIYNCFETLGLDVSFHNWSFGGFKGKNIVATIYGNNPESNGTFIISAHYDCSEGSVGANDDGSGVAGMIAIAEILSGHCFNYTIKFIAFSGEEVGTYGSFIYARDAYNKGDNIIAVLNVDMIAYAVTTEGANLISFLHPERSSWIFNFAESITNNYYDYFNLSAESKPNHRGSDHQAFVDFGYDGVWIVHHDIYPWANTPLDTPDRLNWSYFVKATKFLLVLLAEISERNIDVQAIIKEPYESYLYVIGFPLLQLQYQRNWYSGIRGRTILFGSSLAKVNVISEEEISHVIFCIDDNFLFWDSDPPYEWEIRGWYLSVSIGYHILRVFAYTNSGKMCYDEMDLFMLIKPKYKGKWPPAQPCNPNPFNNEKNVSIDTDIYWNGGDYDPGDFVTYEVYFGTELNPPLLDTIGPFDWDVIHIKYDLTILDSNTTYYWRIVARDVQGATSKGPIWSFTTI